LAHPEKFGFTAQIASRDHMKNALMAVPTVFAEVVTMMGLEHFIPNENVYWWW
jgi:hypothetical protein